MVLRRAVEVVAVRAHLPLEDLGEVRLALGEACNQAVAAGAYAGAGDTLRLSCSVHAADAEGDTPPAIHLLLEAPQAAFFDEPAALSGAAAPLPDAAASAGVISFPASLISRLMQNVVRYPAGRGTAISFMRYYQPR